MIYKVKTVLLVVLFLTIPSIILATSINIENDLYRVYSPLSDPEPSEEYAGDKPYHFRFEVRDKKTSTIKHFTVNDVYRLNDCFLSKNFLNILCGVLPSGACGRTPVCKFVQYDLNMFKRTSDINGVQDYYISPDKKYLGLRFLFNPYKENEFPGLGILDLSSNPPKMEWIFYRKGKIDLIKNQLKDFEDAIDTVDVMGWSSDSKKLFFVASCREEGFLVKVSIEEKGLKSAVKKFDLKPYRNSVGLDIGKVEYSDKKAILSIYDKGKFIKKVDIYYPD